MGVKIQATHLINWKIFTDTQFKMRCAHKLNAEDSLSKFTRFQKNIDILKECFIIKK